MLNQTKTEILFNLLSKLGEASKTNNEIIKNAIDKNWQKSALGSDTFSTDDATNLPELYSFQEKLMLHLTKEIVNYFDK